jgi:hypothetical protein
MQMNLQLHHFVSDITGATGVRIVRAFVAGERDLVRLAALRDQRCKASAETIRQALVGNDREEHIFALKQAVELSSAWRGATRSLVAKCFRPERAVPTIGHQHCSAWRRLRWDAPRPRWEPFIAAWPDV